MIPGLLTAGNGKSWENDLVAALDKPGSGMTVIRRCVDIADVLTIATTGQVSVVVLSAELRRLDTEAVQRLAVAGVAVVGIHPAGDDRAKARLQRIGIDHLVPDDVGSTVLLDAVRAALFGAPEVSPGSGQPAAFADPRFALPSGPAPTDIPFVPVDPLPAGRVIAVWGPVGAPGRTTLAGNLAAETALTGVSTLLVDADVYGGVLASAFGLLDESPGLAGACRQAANGRLDLTEMTKLVWAVGPALRMLTGIARADRWPEIRPSAIPAVLAVARSMASMTIVDCGFCLEADEEITFDTAAPRRNGATLSALAEADVVVVVGTADPPGMERLVRGLAELKDMVPQAPVLVVLNRVRRTAASVLEAAAALARFAGTDVSADLPEDRESMDKCWQLGRPLAEAAPNSALRRAIRDLAATLVPVPVQTGPSAG